jgi:hypothetical protein
MGRRELNSPIANYFWDSCVFIRYLTGGPPQYTKDIAQHITDATSGKTLIHYSTIALAEIKPSQLVKQGYGDINAFFADFEGAFSPIGPSPDILIRAASVRDISYPNPNGGDDRVLGTADAIHLLTCVHARDDLGISDIIFHTMDDGKNRNWEGKCVPLLSFDKWTVGIPRNLYVKQICSLKREPPIHPALPML